MLLGSRQGSYSCRIPGQPAANYTVATVSKQKEASTCAQLTFSVFIQSRISGQKMMPPTGDRVFPTSMNLIKIIPGRHASKTKCPMLS